MSASALRTAPMRIVVLGLSLSSSWGNGHATTYRALLKALAERGHDVTFLERRAPWYAVHRDLDQPDYCRLEFYDDLEGLKAWADQIRNADAVLVGSYVPEGVAVGRWAQSLAGGVVAFYDIDTPVTLAKLERGDKEYLSPDLIPGYDPYFSFTGGPTLDRLMRQYGAPTARPLYCSVDAAIYRPSDRPVRWDLSYLGTYSPDRQPALERLLIEPARRLPELRFVVAGPQYPDDIAWPPNVARFDHVAPTEHPSFYTESQFTLNITRQDMVAAGYSPSVRLFEAAACGTPIISDAWPGLDELFVPGREIVLAETPEAVVRALTGKGADARRSIADAARRRVLAEHRSEHRAAQLEHDLRGAAERRQRTRLMVSQQVQGAQGVPVA